MSTIHSSPIHFIPPSTVGTTSQVLTATDNLGHTAWQNFPNENFNFTNVQFVAKGGNDANSGTSINSPKLTPEAALANITGEGLIWILDSGLYIINMPLVAYNYTLYAPNASLSGTILISTTSGLNLVAEYALTLNITVDGPATIGLEVRTTNASSLTLNFGAQARGNFGQQYYGNTEFKNNLTIDQLLTAGGYTYPNGGSTTPGFVMTATGPNAIGFEAPSALFPPNGVQIFVSQQIGNDLTGTGSYTNPFATFTHALIIAGAPPPTAPVIIIGLDGNTYNEQLTINNANVYISAHFSQLIWSGVGDAVTVNAVTFGTLIDFGVIGATGGGNALVNNTTETVIINTVVFQNGNIVNNGSGSMLINAEFITVDVNNTSTGIIVINAGLFTGNTTNSGGGNIFYDVGIRIGTDGTGVYGISSQGSTAPQFTVNQFIASGITYPTVDAPSNGYVMTRTAPNTLTLQPPVTGFTSINEQIFTSSGTYTPTAGMSQCTVEVIGAGGGGGGVTASGIAQAAVAGGGGAGAYSKSLFSSGTIGPSQAVTIGAGGTGGPAGNNNGTNGGSTSFGALLSCSGGNGGFGGSASGNMTFYGVFGAGGGALISGQINVNGNSGELGLGFGPDAIGIGGHGGDSFYGIGGEQLINLPGANGFNYGSGGGGASSGNTAAAAGGNGAGGIVIITEYII
jgi:hypothetical protein